MLGTPYKLIIYVIGKDSKVFYLDKFDDVPEKLGEYSYNYFKLTFNKKGYDIEGNPVIE